MIERFSGENYPILIASLAKQFSSGDEKLGKAISDAGELLEFKAGSTIIQQDGEDNDVFFIVSGEVDVYVNKQKVRTLAPGNHFGEMAALEPTLKRSASIISVDTVVAVKVGAASFIQLANAFPDKIWLPVAQELARRLLDRNKFMPKANELPKVFIISSIEGLEIARTIQGMLKFDVLANVWDHGAFWAGSFPVEDLENVVNQHDFGIAVALFEDMVESRDERRPSIRDNVLFELGMFMGRLGRKRSILVHQIQKNLKLPSDLTGINTATFINGSSDELSGRLGPAVTEIRKIIKREGVRT